MKDDRWLVAAVLAGPLAWGADLVASTMMVEGRTAASGGGALLLVSMAAFAIAVGAALRASQLMHRVEGERRRFMAHLGVALGLFFALAIAAQALPRFVFLPAEAV